jgi:hypothetical protein
VECIDKGKPGYDKARVIANSRFDLYPTRICYCESAKDVQQTLAQARDQGIPVRIRSGGHHHEGMCSADGALIVDLSRIDHIRFDGDQAWIGPGAKLEAVYAAMKAEGHLFSGGGCGDVRVGGLVQGGGWGPYSRHLGMTCDRLLGFEIVTAGGERITAGGSDHPALTWAVRGGGGGNFGVVTDFRFELAPRPAHVESFTITWDEQSLVAPVVEEWRRNFPHDPNHDLTTFCRLTVVGPGSGDSPVLIGGIFLGPWDELVDHLRELLPDTFDRGHLERPPEGLTTHPDYQPGPPLAPLRALHSGVADQDLADTCAGIPHRHKVSSSFPNRRFLDGDDAVRAIVDYLAGSRHEPEARLYLSLHCMGGSIAAKPADWSAFAFRDKPFMLQYQAWWAGADRELQRRCLDWVTGFRKRMADYTEFAFINFPDADLASDRKQLLRYYYAGNLDQLIAIKRSYDPHNLFDFGMSIPIA